MIKRIVLCGALLLATSCYTEEAFGDDFGRALCAWYVECTPLFSNVDDCLSSGDVDDDTGTTGDDGEDCEFVPEKAQECVDGMRDMGCTVLPVPMLPRACTEVCES